MSNETLGLTPSAPGHGDGAKTQPRNGAPVPPRRPDAKPNAPKPGPSNGAPRKMTPPEQTHAEDFYYVKQIQAKTKLVIVLRDGEEVQGVIEWYDRSCLKVAPLHEPPMVIYKAAIKYMYKQSEG